MQKKVEGMGGTGGDRRCLIPILRAKQVDTVSNPSLSISIMANSPTSLDATIDEATSLFRNIRDLRVTNENNFNINRSDSIQAQLSGQLLGIDHWRYGPLVL